MQKEIYVLNEILLSGTRLSGAFFVSSQVMNIEPIAYFRSLFPTKFGIPRQSGIIEELRGQILFEHSYACADALRGLEGFDYLWLIWGFSGNAAESTGKWHATVRPPLLGGNRAVGVFATRSPFRPNALGLSSVKIESIECVVGHSPVINVCGADLMDGTPIYDIKPYVAYCDAHPEARSGFVDEHKWQGLSVLFPPELERRIPSGLLGALKKVLALDPRPQYHRSPTKEYGMPFDKFDVRFTVDGDTLTVIDVVPL